MEKWAVGVWRTREESGRMGQRVSGRLIFSSGQRPLREVGNSCAGKPFHCLRRRLAPKGWPASASTLLPAAVQSLCGSLHGESSHDLILEKVLRLGEQHRAPLAFADSSVSHREAGLQNRGFALLWRMAACS